MKGLFPALLFAFLAYLLYDTFAEKATILSRKRLCDYTAAGSVYEDVQGALRRGIRLLEVHVYSDERDQPVVSMVPQSTGRDFTDNNVSFEQVCIDIANDAFPSKDPMILSIVPHTDKSVTMNKVAEHLTTITRRHLTDQKSIQTAPIDSLANKLILVSGGPIHGTALEPLLNLSWSDSGLRRMTYQQALHPRDPEDLKRYAENNIVMVAEDPMLKTLTANPNTPLSFGCQWNFFVRDPPGFVVKSSPA
jgi:hypothetical protein